MMRFVARGVGSVSLALALLTGLAGAQERTDVKSFELTGVVTGEQGEPLVGAFVSPAGSDWGSLTDERGRFRLPDTEPGTLSLEVQQLAYDTLRWTGTVQPGSSITLRMKAEPIVLEGLHVVTDRFERRRRATAVQVRYFDRATLATTSQQSALDFLGARAGYPRVDCGVHAWSDLCFWVRGRAVEPSVWIDETPVIGGIDYLAAVSPYELYMVEVYGNGRQIRIYTNRFMERAAKDHFRPLPFIL